MIEILMQRSAGWLEFGTGKPSSDARNSVVLAPSISQISARGNCQFTCQTALPAKICLHTKVPKGGVLVGKRRD